MADDTTIPFNTPEDQARLERALAGYKRLRTTLEREGVDQALLLLALSYEIVALFAAAPITDEGAWARTVREWFTAMDRDIHQGRSHVLLETLVHFERPRLH